LPAANFKATGPATLVSDKILLIVNKLVFIQHAYKTTNVFLSKQRASSRQKDSDWRYLSDIKRLMEIEKIAISAATSLLLEVAEKSSLLKERISG
jgi:hypothetical protein